MKTKSLKKTEVQRNWHLMDVRGVTLGRAAARVAALLIGKHKTTFTPNVDNGDFVIVINAKDIVLTGRKMSQKMHITHSLYPGGLTAIPYSKALAEKPEKIFENAVRGMLPKNRLGKKIFQKLKVYKDSEHPHQAQQPETITLN